MKRSLISPDDMDGRTFTSYWMVAKPPRLNYSTRWRKSPGKFYMGTGHYNQRSTNCNASALC